MKRVNKIILFLCALILTPKVSHANVGTPLMLFSAFHLFIGNTIIGIIEGLVIAKVFKVKKRRSIFFMILANYFSTVAAGSGLVYLGYNLSQRADLYSISIVVGILSGLAFILTVVLEWPFCLWILKGREKVVAQSWRASLWAQIVSYVFILFPIYMLLSGYSLVTKTHVDKNLSFNKIEEAWLYYVSLPECGIYKARLDGKDHQKIGTYHADKCTDDYGYGRLFVKSKEGAGQDLWMINGGGEDPVKVLDNVQGQGAVNERCSEEEKCSPYFMGALDLRDKDARNWKVWTGFWPIEGISGENKKLYKKFRIAIETPFVAWSIGNATVLPGDQVVFQLGGNQIVLMDLNSLEIGIIAHGFAPAVLLGE